MKITHPKSRRNGFTNQQAIFLLILFFPLLLAAAGIITVFVKRSPIALSNPPTTSPQSPSRSTGEVIPSQEKAEVQQINNDQINEGQARQVVENWLAMKAQIFAPPFDTKVADQIVAAGPLWTDLTKTDGSIDWLKKNNSYYTYNSYQINGVSQFNPSTEMPTILVSITEDSVLHSTRGNDSSTKTGTWLYTLKRENGTWKVWDYRKQGN